MKTRKQLTQDIILICSGFLLLVLILFIPIISTDWDTTSVVFEPAQFERWRISSFIRTRSDSLIVGGTLFTGTSTRNPNKRYYKAGFKNIKVYLKDTLLTLSFDTVDFHKWNEIKKVTSVKSRDDKEIKMELETVFNNDSNIIDTTFTLLNYRKTRVGFVFQFIYYYVLAWIFVLSPH